MCQVLELVSKLLQYPPPRIPEESRPTNQDEDIQKPPTTTTKEDTEMEDVTELQTNEDDSYYSLFQPKLTKTTPQPDMEYGILPEPKELKPIPSPPLIPQPPPPPPPPPP
ncbi:hypothetical protein P167DRAFT_540867, partial [Morchella conica CCBAS932]